MTEKSVVTECDLPQAPDKVWRALTVPELLEAWLPDAVKSEILEAKPNRLLRYRWPGNEQDKDARGQTLESVVTFELTGTEAGGTHLRVEHRLQAASNVVPFRGRRTVAMGGGGMVALRWAA
jgi:uncharacterized protein YndB with AHSA1/START domain